MATTMVLSEAEYLRTSFEGPEPDYVDGELVDRPMPNVFHSDTLICLGDCFKPWQDRRQLFRATEIRIRVEPDRFRVADFAVFASKQTQPIPVDAPYAVVEIVSPDERFEELMSKLADYESAGVEYLFIADPPLRRLARYRHGDLVGVPALELPAYDVAIPVDSIFG